MGFIGDIVVIHNPESRGLAALAEHAGGDGHPVYREWSFADAWHAFFVRHFDEPFEYDMAWLTGLMNRTGAPVLVCNVLESDLARVRGVSAAGPWEGWLDHDDAAAQIANTRWSEYMSDPANHTYTTEGYLDPPYELIDVFRAEAELELERHRGQCARDAARWAAAAGRGGAPNPFLPPPAAGGDPFVESLFFDLLETLGFGPAEPHIVEV